MTALHRHDWSAWSALFWRHGNQWRERECRTCGYLWMELVWPPLIARPDTATWSEDRDMGGEQP